jgi:FtsP/CotA-like multicopper oxidase with cupredoxin domain
VIAVRNCIAHTLLSKTNDMLSRRDFLSAGTWSLVAAAVGEAEITRKRRFPHGSKHSRLPDVTLRIVNILQEVTPNRIYKTKAYDGVVPAPLIRLQEGVPAEVHIINETDTPEYVHWHGLHVPPAIDGTEEEGSLVVPANGELRYWLTPSPSGARYVHSHAMSGMHLEGGTYSGQFGFVYVEPKQNKGRYDQEVFVATHEWGPELFWQQENDDDDVPKHSISSAPAGEWEVEYDIGSINGKALGHGEPIQVKQGQRVLFHLLNASATATVRIAFAGHQFLIIALDGNKVPSPQWVETIELGVAERVDAIVEMNHPGVWILGAVDNVDREVGAMGVVVEYAGKTGTPQWIAPSRQSWDYTIFGGPAAEGTPAISLPMIIDRTKPARSGMGQWTINGKTYDPSAPLVIRTGTPCRLMLQNRSDDDHPMHLHRDSFELKSVNGKRTSGLVKDVVVLRAHAKLELEFIPDRCGLSLFHCHQQMHMDNGFKILFKVE